MMDAKEVLELVKHAGFNLEEPGHTEVEKVVVNALEKQIPQRPDLEGDGYDDGGNLIYDTGYCPRCRYSYEVDYHRPKYCENCGQALDWSADDEE